MIHFYDLKPAEKRQKILDFLNAHPRSTYKELCAGLGVPNEGQGVSVILQSMRRRGEADRELLTGRREYSLWFALADKTADMERPVYRKQKNVDVQRQAEIDRFDAERRFRATKPDGAVTIRLGDRPAYKNQGGQGCVIRHSSGSSAILGEKT